MSEDFLRRWSRLKRDVAAPKNDLVEENQPKLPALDSLNFESDFKAFMHSKVEETVKRAALKKLFSDPRFNVIDGLDTHIDDYTKADPISEELLGQLEHARRTLFVPKPEEEQPSREEGEKEEPQKQDADPAQNA